MVVVGNLNLDWNTLASLALHLSEFIFQDHLLSLLADRSFVTDISRCPGFGSKFCYGFFTQSQSKLGIAYVRSVAVPAVWIQLYFRLLALGFTSDWHQGGIISLKLLCLGCFLVIYCQDCLTLNYVQELHYVTKLNIGLRPQLRDSYQSFSISFLNMIKLYPCLGCKLANECPRSVSVAYNDGHTEDIVHIPGSPGYLALMRNLAEHPERHNYSELTTSTDKFYMINAYLQQRFKVILGRPATPNAGILGQMLKSLRSATQTHLSSHVSTISIATATAAQLSLQEINDALVHAGLRELDKWQAQDNELNAGYAAHGFGLCPSYRDPYECETEENTSCANHEVLQLDCTNHTLAANGASISSARETYATRIFVDWSLGREESRQQPNGSDHWDKVKNTLTETFAAAVRPYDMLLLTGECAGDQHFFGAVRMALKDNSMANNIHVKSNSSSAFTVARGVSEMQRRRQQGWLDCVQPKHCNQSSSLRSIVQRFREL